MSKNKRWKVSGIALFQEWKIIPDNFELLIIAKNKSDAVKNAKKFLKNRNNGRHYIACKDERFEVETYD